MRMTMARRMMWRSTTMPRLHGFRTTRYGAANGTPVSGTSTHAGFSTPSSGTRCHRGVHMKQPPFSYAGRVPKVIATRVVALYDAKSGRIHHCHTVHIHEGGREVSEQEAIEAAHRHAGRLGHDTARLKVKLSG